MCSPHTHAPGELKYPPKGNLGLGGADYTSPHNFFSFFAFFSLSGLALPEPIAPMMYLSVVILKP